MKRKFVTEYALHYMNSYTAMMTSYELMRGGQMNSDDEKMLDKCHIYIIAARPSPYFKPQTLKHENNLLSGTLCYRIGEQEYEHVFESYPWRLEGDAVTIDCKYPYKEIVSLNVDGQEVTFIPASIFSIRLNEMNLGVRDLNNYEVLYVGQAIGNGTRSAKDRLKSHSTLQKILALTAHDYPGKEIMIFMYEFNNDQIMVSTDGAAKKSDNTEKNEDRLMNAIENPPKKSQKIGLIEAGLIRYFQPYYNEIFKVKFPSTKHKVLRSCYDLDVTGLIVELHSTNMGYFLYSSTVLPSSNHIANFDLVSSKNRHSFFHATNFVQLPNIIKS